MLRKTGQGENTQNANSHNDHSGNQGFTAPFDESGEDMHIPDSDESSIMSQQDDEEMEDLSQGQEPQEVN